MWVLWIVGAIASAVAGAVKGRSPVKWFFYGVLIWPVAIVHALCLATPAPQQPIEDRDPCPFCSRPISPEVKFCPFCGKDVTTADRVARVLQKMMADQRRGA